MYVGSSYSHHVLNIQDHNTIYMIRHSGMLKMLLKNKVYYGASQVYCREINNMHVKAIPVQPGPLSFLKRWSTSHAHI